MSHASTAPRQPLTPSRARTIALACSALLALTGAGCSRDLEIPPERIFSASAARASVAPSEIVTLTASDGVPPYQWSFAQGGRLSGDDASLSPAGATASYRAGSAGSAQDLIDVVDAGGSSVRLAITVGPRLALSPAASLVAPGGRLVFQAAGGKPPYFFALTEQGSGLQADLRGRPLLPVADYQAGGTGDVQDVVAVTDSSPPPGVTVLATVRITSALQIFPRAVTAAPSEVLSFAAFGGQPPYTFQGTGSIETLDATVGLVRVGSLSGGPSLVQVIDANQRTASAEVTLLPALRASLASTDVRGGAPIRVEATGGKPPYAFSFAPRGNRSHATLDPVGGLWTPGPSPGAVDHLRVADATGTEVAVDPPPVGPLQLTPGTGVMRCVAGDFDGNGVADLAFLHQRMALTQVTGVGSSSSVQRTYHVGTDYAFPTTWVEDPSGDGLDEIVFLGARRGAPIDPFLGGQDSGLWALQPGLDGSFSKSGLLVNGLSNQTGAWIGVFPTVDGNASFLVTERIEASLLRGVSWVLGSAVAPKPVGIPVASSAELMGDAFTHVTQLAAVELDGDLTGPLDLVLFKGGGNSTDSPGPAYVRYGALNLGAPEYRADAITAVPFPTGYTFRSAMDGDQRRLVALPSPGTGTPGGLLVRLEETATGRGALWILHGRPASWTAVADLLGGAGFDGAALLPASVAGISDVVGWGVDGGYVFFQVLSNFQLMQGTPANPNPLAGSAGFPIEAGCAADVSGDGAADLILGGDSVSTAEVRFGDGAGGFGTRPHLRGASWPAAMGDFDGDGIGDVVASEGGLGLALLHGDDDQLGWSGRISGGPAALVTAGPYLPGAPGDSVIFRSQAGAFYLVAGGAAGFSAPQPLPSRRPDGRPVVATFIPLAINAALGGPDPGPDLLTWESDNSGSAWAHVLWREGGAIVDLVSQAIGPAGAGGQKIRDCWFLPVGAEDGRTSWGADEVHAGLALAGLCSFENPVDPQRSPNLVRALGATIIGAGATLRLSTWSVSAPITGAAGTTFRVAPLGTLGGRALFAMGGSGFSTVMLGGTGAAANPATWTTVPATPVTFFPFTEWHPFLGALGDLDGDGASDAVMTTLEQRLVVLRNTGTDAAPVFKAWPGTERGVGGAGILPLGVRPSRWETRPYPGNPGLLGLPSVMTFSGDFDNLGIEPEIIPLRNQVRAGSGLVLK